MSDVLSDDPQSDHDSTEVTGGDTAEAARSGLLPRQKRWLAIVIVVNLLLWLIPSDVVEQIANDRHTMLGRYSRTHFSWIVACAVISLISVYIDLGVGAEYKRRWFLVIASLIVMTPALALIDFLMRSPTESHYVRDTLAYHRPAHFTIEQVFEDKPVTYRTYPNAAKGYEPVTCRLTIDGRGYRNLNERSRYDVVALGDSFTEGSSVSDEHPWPVRLEASSGLSVYNLGMSGYDPLHYLESLRLHGLSLKPRFVVCMIYEGNDFRSAKSDGKRRKPSASANFKRYMKQSPMVRALDQFLIDTFGRINADGPLSGADAISWLPLTIPEGAAPRAYAFAPKQLRDLYIPEQMFATDKHWLNPRAQLATMNELCRNAGSTLVVVFAPTKAHVALPMVGDRLAPEPVRAFTKYKYKDELPAPPTFLKELLARVEAKETVVKNWCARESIAFISVTDALREAMGSGAQAYYTYDQHWTPIGHEVVGAVIASRLNDASFIAPVPEPGE